MRPVRTIISLSALILFIAGCQPISGGFFISDDSFILGDRNGEAVEISNTEGLMATVHIHDRRGSVTLEAKIDGQKHLFDFDNAFTPSSYEGYSFFVSSMKSGQPYDMGWSLEEPKVEMKSVQVARSCTKGTAQTCGYEYDPSAGESVYRCRTVTVQGRQELLKKTFKSAILVSGAFFVPNTNEEVANFELSKNTGTEVKYYALSECR